MTDGQITLEALGGGLSDFLSDPATDLLARWAPLNAWFKARAASGVDPYCRSSASKIAPYAIAVDRVGHRLEGINFASQDYLNLAGHPEVIEAACQAAKELGVHSAGSASLMGGSTIALKLEEELCAFLGLAECTLFPTGWGAGYGVVKTLVRPDDHIVIDALAHASLQEGARASGAKIHFFPHNSVTGAERRLRRIRATDAHGGILLVTESLFSMDSDTPDIGALQRLASSYGATLAIDIAHDLGAMAPNGGGFLELQAMMGKVDVVMGSFGKTFASNGGFVASNSRLKLPFRTTCGPQLFTNALSPVQAAVVLKSLSIIRSPEGAQRREHLRRNVVAVRSALEAEGFEILGDPSAIVPVVMGDAALTRLLTRATLDAGVLVNMAEFPVVARNACRWRLQVMADHSAADIDRLAKTAVRSRDMARAWLAGHERVEEASSSDIVVNSD